MARAYALTMAGTAVRGFSGGASTRDGVLSTRTDETGADSWVTWGGLTGCCAVCVGDGTAAGADDAVSRVVRAAVSTSVACRSGRRTGFSVLRVAARRATPESTSRRGEEDAATPGAGVVGAAGARLAARELVS